MFCGFFYSVFANFEHEMYCNQFEHQKNFDKVVYQTFKVRIYSCFCVQQCLWVVSAKERQRFMLCNKILEDFVPVLGFTF